MKVSMPIGCASNKKIKYYTSNTIVMKLSEAVQFASSHERFISFLDERDINPNSVNELTAKVTNVQDSIIEHRIFFDFGEPGRSSKDIRVIVDFDRNTRKFSFVQIDILGR